MDKSCKYPQCQKCDYDYCIKDGTVAERKTPKKRDRRAYYKEYYQRKKHADKVVRISNEHYIRYSAVRDAVSGLKKQIGEVNYNLVMDAINVIENDEKYEKTDT